MRHEAACIGTAETILETPPSTDDTTLDEVLAKIGHFSNYAVAYRSGTL